MASLIDLRRRIRSVKSTQQITKAMKMVAAARLRRSQERVIAARPYARTLETVLAEVAARMKGAAGDVASAETVGAPAQQEKPLHPLLVSRPEKKVLLIVVTGDRGLCGSFNTNVNRAAGAFLREAPAKGTETLQLVTLGRKGHDFWRRRGVPIAQGRPGIFSGFSHKTATEIARALAEKFVAGEVDAVYAVYNEFKSVIAQVVRTKRLLPLQLGAAESVVPKGATAAELKGGAAGGVDYLFEPAPEELLAKLLPRHLEFQTYQLLLESDAAENAARMTAMDAASKNAGEMIGALSLTYNRARQARITKELIEVVSGAAAQS